MRFRDCGYVITDADEDSQASAKSREPLPPAYWVLLAAGLLLVCMIAGGVLFSHMHAPGAASAAIVSSAPVADVVEPVPAVTPLDFMAGLVIDLVRCFLFIMLLPLAAWIYYIFAVTKLGQQLDRTCDDIHTISQNSRHDEF